MTGATVEDRAIAGLLAAAWLACYESISDMARLAPTARLGLDVARWSLVLIPWVDAVDADVDAEELEDRVLPIQRAFTEFSLHVAPRTWGEAVLKTWLMVGAGEDLMRLTGEHWPAGAKELAGQAVSRPLAEPLREVLFDLAGDQQEQWRLGLFGRRVIAEATAQCQRIAARQPELAGALLDVEEGSLDELSGTTQLIADLVEGAAQRMLELGLQP